MTNMSFIEKLRILFDITKSSMTYLAIIIVLIILASILLSIKRKNMKKAQGLLILSYVMILVFLLLRYQDSLAKIFDYMMNNFFIAIYFPNLAIYLAAIIATNIILLTSITSKKTSNLIKKINVLVFTIITYILILILNIIKENNLDVFTQTSVYGNKNAQALIELSSIIFIIWIIFLIVYKLVRTYILNKRVPYKALDSNKYLSNNSPSAIKKEMTVAPIKRLEKQETIKEVEPIKEIEPVKEAKPLKEKPYFEIEPPHYVLKNNQTKVEKTKPLKEKPYFEIEPPYYVLANNNQIKVEKPKTETAMYDNLLTLDDYKLVLDVLKKAKEEQREKKEREEKIRLEEEKLRELREIYQSIS